MVHVSDVQILSNFQKKICEILATFSTTFLEGRNVSLHNLASINRSNTLSVKKSRPNYKVGRIFYSLAENNNRKQWILKFWSEKNLSKLIKFSTDFFQPIR